MQKSANILDNLATIIPDITLIKADIFSWKPSLNSITYIDNELATDHGALNLLHEAGHALKNHQTYAYDVELLRLEAEAWDIAKSICKDMSINFNTDIAQDNLDTYRDWLHQRSTCITCGFISLQTEPGIYRCFNCDSRWSVPHTPICRRKAT